jgi:hypothetical protein
MQESIKAFGSKISEGDVTDTQVDPIPGDETAEEAARDRWNELVQEFLLCK